MLLIDTLRGKSEFTHPKTNEIIIDLTEASFKFTGPQLITGTVLVTEDFAMRPDLVAKHVLGNQDKFDYLLKFNSISNPFSIDRGDILLLIDETSMKLSKAIGGTETKKEDIRKRFFDPKRLSKKDQKRLDFIKKKSSTLPNASAQALPPNFAEPGSQEMKVVDGKIIFGGDVVVNKDNCPEPASRARVKAKLLENKIFKNNR